MKRALMMGVIGLVMVSQPGVVWAQDVETEASAAEQQTAVCPYKAAKGQLCGTYGQGTWGRTRCDIAGIARMTMPKSVVAAGDGGVVVLAGSRLLKYDAELKLIKEVVVDADVEGMKAVMGKIDADCPPCQKQGDTE